MASDPNGYVRIYRRLLDHPAFRNKSEAMAFACLILEAQWRRRTVRYKGRELELERGQVALSLRDFGREWGRERSWAARLIERLEKSELVVRANRDRTETATETAPTVLSICNYDKYQAPEVVNETVVELFQRQDRDSTETQNKEENKGKKRKNLSPTPFLPELPDWLPGDVWEAFTAMRQSIKKPMTETAMKLIIGKLDRFRRLGFDPVQVLERSIVNCWQDVFEPKGNECRIRPKLEL